MEYLKYNAQSLPKIILTGKVYVPDNNCHFARKPSEYILYFITKGAMTIMEDDEVYNLKKGDLLILDPSHSHKGKQTNSDVEYYFIHFKCHDISIIDSKKENIDEYVLKNKMEDSPNEIMIIPKNIHLNKKSGPIQNLIFLLTADFPCKNDLYRTTASIRLIEIFTNLSVSGLEKQEGAIGKNRLVMDLINFIHENATQNICSQNIEEHFNMNFDYLNRIFKATTNSTIMNYSNKYRIAESKKLLKSGLYNVKETADLMGFTNEFYFSRVFKKYEGISPSEYI